MGITSNFPTGSSSVSLSRTLIASYTTAGTYTWIIPEEIKKKGFVDVYIMGGGGSGGAAVAVNGDSNYAYTLAMGGASGYTTILNNYPITDKTSINIIVGEGGSSVVADSSLNTMPSSYGKAQYCITTGTIGGTSKFDIYEALGGEGGLAKYAFSDSGASFYRLKGANGGSGSTGIYYNRWLITGYENLLPGSNGSDGSFGKGSDSFPDGVSEVNYIGTGIGINNVANKYDTGAIMGAAGGFAASSIDGSLRTYAQPGVVTAYGSSGAGATGGISGYSATGNGNGGGAVTHVIGKDYTPITVTSGAGAPGLVLIYG